MPHCSRRALCASGSFRWVEFPPSPTDCAGVARTKKRGRSRAFLSPGGPAHRAISWWKPASVPRGSPASKRDTSVAPEPPGPFPLVRSVSETEHVGQIVELDVEAGENLAAAEVHVRRNAAHACNR